MNKNVIMGFVVGSILVGCASSQDAVSPRQDQKTIATGTSTNTRPFWTYEGDVDMKKLQSSLGDNPSEPKNMYVISRATVAKEDLVPNCYQMARTRTSSEVSQTVAEVVKSANALSSSADANEFEGLITTNSQQMVVGASVAEKTWAKVSEDGDVKVHCWVVMSMPRNNLKKLQDMVIKQLEQANGGDPTLKARVKTAMDNMQQEF